MAKTRVYTFVKQTLTYQALNAEFDNIINSPMALISPATANLDMDGYTLILDSDGDSSLGGGTDDIAKLTLGGFLAFQFDGTAASSVNGLIFASTATGTYPTITATGDTNVGINLVPGGSGTININGNILAGDIVNASTTWDPGSLDDGQSESKDVTATGVALGDLVIGVSFSLDVVDLNLEAQVTATDTVTCRITNHTGGTVNLGSGTVKVKVLTGG